MAVNKSRLTLARAAIRPAMHGRMLISGPSGSGKTQSALTIAEVLAGPEGRILVIDTEKESALTYADLFKFEHLRWQAPFDPRELAETLMEAGETYDVAIIDSFTHFWRGNGGTLDIANGKFTGWKDARPAQVDVTEAILEADCHVICCVRSKMAHAQETNAAGKQQVVKLGMAPEQDDDFEYEVNVSIEIDMQHALQIGKSRTNAVPVGRVFSAGHAEEFANIYKEWLAGGEPVADRTAVDAMIAELNTIADRGEKVKAKEVFLECFGRPEFLLKSRLEEAQDWVRERVAQVTGVTGGPVSPPEGDSQPSPGAAPLPEGNEVFGEPDAERVAVAPSSDAGESTTPEAESPPAENAGVGEGAPPSVSEPAPAECALCGSTRAQLTDPSPTDGNSYCVNDGACNGRRQINARKYKDDQRAIPAA
jgi:energy-coupling factor transporter ATP-binding protein EcfA2